MCTVSYVLCINFIMTFWVYHMEKSIRFPTMQYPFFCLLSLVKCISIPLNSKIPLRYHFTSKLPLRYHITIYVANDNAMFCLTFDHKICSNTSNVWRKVGPPYFWCFGEWLTTLNQEVNHVQSSVPPVVIPTLQCNTNAVKQQQRTIGPK